ncbi:hypothetical protein RvY_07889 [Ramazzottius varieornatus]|uniref:Pseudouridine synthase II N-terminal domain-containing protein n=1 Tax=Ramazzottius varieornatus TaxID=947166 RepID=A0A1D1V3V4_RAMVA|nr:hypothetical protein RvY_07889 [Ramazzottius varieornatus]
MAVLEKAAEAWRLLNGVFCVYKPAGITFNSIRFRIANKLTDELNAMQREDVPPLVKILPPSPEDDSAEFRVTTVPDLRRHPLVVGPGYTKEDFYIRHTTGFLKEMAGVTVVSIGSGSPRRIFEAITDRNPVCTYHIDGKFGLRTDDYLETGRVLEKTSFDFVTRTRLQKFLSFYQARYQKLIYQAYGVDPQSQEAYEMHSRGLLRPGNVSNPLLYRIQCVSFHKPYFTLEVQCVNETDKFLLKILNDVAEDLKSSAVCTKIRRIRWGNFTLDHALLYKHWNVAGIIEGINECGPAVRNELRLLEEPYLTDVKDIPQGPRLTAGDPILSLSASNFPRIGT